MKLTKLIALALVGLMGMSSSHLTERQRALHALNRLGFGPRPGDVDAVMRIGVDRWIDQQLHPERISDAAVDARLRNFPTLQLSDRDLVQKYYMPIVAMRREAKGDENTIKEMREKIPYDQRPQRVVEDLVSQRIVRAVDSDRQLNEVMVDFWMNHFNVFIGKGVDRFLLTSYERDTVRPHIWGKFEELLMATAKSPAMLFYLDNAQSMAAPQNRPALPPRFAMRALQQPQGKRGGGLNENYAREIMELHTLGVDGGYTQKDVTELARVFTGWSIARPQEGDTGFVFRRAVHDVQPKTVLGVRFPAGGGIEEGERMIHFLAHQPATAHHIAYQLCQRLVSDDPPQALVDRVAKRFMATDGDLRETVKAVINSPEFWDPGVYRAKMKSPFEYVVSAIRAVDAHVDNPLPVARTLQQIGEPLYGAQPPTGYKDTADAWTSSGALLNRLNFAMSLANNTMLGVNTNVNALVGNVDAASCVDALGIALTGGNLTEETRQTIKSKGGAQVRTIAGLILGSPEFQRQ
ncbi:MAG TPA: DUF1800 domain-containing protein [Thermoanaerobaculia bacterium]|nr:DUF1800 domain-containing protein [Thermoanaerobaculia bacterium]